MHEDTEICIIIHNVQYKYDVPMKASVLGNTDAFLLFSQILDCLNRQCVPAVHVD